MFWGRHGAVAEGVVATLATQVLGRGTSEHRLLRPVIAFTDSRGTKVRYMETVTKLGSVQPGERVTVRYDPADPEHTATIATWADMRYQLIAAAVVLLVFAVICVNGVLLIAGVVGRRAAV